MKDINKLKNYRTKYKRYYNIDFGSDFVVHHIDFDRNNNDIKNLVLLPKELHQRYHFYLTVLGGENWKSGEIKINALIDKIHFQMYTNGMMIGFLDTLKECSDWYFKKVNMDLNKALTDKTQR